MEFFNFLLTLLFIGLTLYMAYRIYVLRNEIVVQCIYMNGYRIFMIVCFVASVIVSFFGNKTVLDVIRSIAIACMVGLFLCMKEGAGENGFVSSGSLISYDSVLRYDYKIDKNIIFVYIIYSEKVRNGTEETDFQLKFSKLSEKKLLSLLQNKLPKKHIRMKKV